METAINALWDAGPRLGDRIAIVGGGMIGGALAGLLRTFPLAWVQLIDVNPARAVVAEAFGIAFAHPDDAGHDFDIVFHTSATAAGLNLSLELAGNEAEVIELSWYGTARADRCPGRRLSPSAADPAREPGQRRQPEPAVHAASHEERLIFAVELLRDDAYDVLLTGSSPFAELPDTMQRLASGELDAICHVIDY